MCPCVSWYDCSADSALFHQGENSISARIHCSGSRLVLQNINGFQVFLWFWTKQPETFKAKYAVAQSPKEYINLSKTMGGGPHQYKVLDGEGKIVPERGVTFNVEHLPLDFLRETFRLVNTIFYFYSH